MAVDVQRGADATVAEHQGNGLHIDAFGNQPGCEAVAQVVPPPALDRVPAEIDIAKPKDPSGSVPLFNGIEDPGLRCRRVEVRLACNAAATRLHAL